MYSQNKNKTKLYWSIVLLLVLVIPALIFIFVGKSQTPAPGIKFTATLLKDQPTDTLVANKIIPIHSWTTKNGVKVVFVPTEDLPIVDISVGFNAGSSRDDAKFGLASLVGSLLDQGTINMPSPDDIAIAFESVGALYNCNVDRDKTQVLLRSLNERNNLNKVVALFSDVIATPAFNEKDIEIVRDQKLVKIQYENQLPAAVATKAFYNALYNEHPYAHPIDGLNDTVKQITKDDLHNFHQKFYVADNATISIVGGIHRDHAKEIAETISMRLAKGSKPANLPKVAELDQKIIQDINLPVNQSTILLGRLGIDIFDKDKYALIMGNYILGGGQFASRLLNTLRVKHGLAYSVCTNLDLLQEPGPFVASLETKLLSTKEALEMLHKDINDFVAKGPTEKEVVKAKKYLIGAMPLYFDSNEKILIAVSRLAFYNLPLDYYDQYPGNIEKLTAEDVKQAIAKKLNMDKSVQVVLSAAVTS